MGFHSGGSSGGGDIHNDGTAQWQWYISVPKSPLSKNMDFHTLDCLKYRNSYKNRDVFLTFNCHNYVSGWDKSRGLDGCVPVCCHVDRHSYTPHQG